MIAAAKGIPMSRISLALLLMDVVALLALFNIAYWYELESWLGVYSIQLYGLIVLQLLTLYIFDLYSVEVSVSRADLLARTVLAVVTTGVIMAGIVYITKAGETERLFFRGVLSGGFILFLFWALASRYLVTIWKRKYASKIRWLVISDVTPDSPLCKDIAAVDSIGEATILVSDLEKTESLPLEIGRMVKGSFTTFRDVVNKKWSGIVIATEGKLPDDILRRIMEKRLSGTRIYDLTDFYETYLEKIPVMQLRDNWFALSHGFDLLHHNMQLRIKRLLDVALAVILLVVTSPFMLLVVLAIALDLRKKYRGPVIYRQLRTGMGGEEFYIYKFRTMVEDAEAEGPQWAIHNDTRITPIGRFLRKTRLDELPQLWNVLKGDMSFIGPRPERPDFNRELERAIPYYDLRHLIKPGITGWAQVKYNYGSSTEEALEKLQYDIYYIKNYSLLLDLFIVLKTIRVILGQRGR